MGKVISLSTRKELTAAEIEKSAVNNMLRDMVRLKDALLDAGCPEASGMVESALDTYHAGKIAAKLEAEVPELAAVEA